MLSWWKPWSMSSCKFIRMTTGSLGPAWLSRVSGCVNVCLKVCMIVCMHECVCLSLHKNLWVYIYIYYVCMWSAYMSVFWYVCECLSVCERMWVCERVYLWLWVHTWVYCVGISLRVCVYTHMCEHVCMSCVSVYVYSRVSLGCGSM